jgi:hypothetical protein
MAWELAELILASGADAKINIAQLWNFQGAWDETRNRD